MNSQRLLLKAGTILLLAASVIAGPASGTQADGPARFVVAKDAKSTCTLVAPLRSELQRRAAQAVVDGVRDVSGVALPVVAAELPASVSWVLVDAPAAEAANSAALRDALKRIGGQKALSAGFAFHRDDHAVVLLAADERTGYRGSVHCRDALLQVQRDEVFLDEYPALASPLAVRGIYHLTCWGRSPEYQLKDWKVAFDAFAEDGMNADFFWMCGLFRSQKCPQAFSYPANALTTDEVRQLIAYAHSIGVDFYLGSGVFAWFGMDALANAHPETKAVGSGGMCPSNPLARKLNLDYLTEMYDTFPDAVGMFLEIRDEYGACKCARCKVPAASGGTHYAQAELTFLRELSQAVWKKHPQAKFVWCLGYSEGNVHADDKAYFEHLTRTFSDPRFQWLVVRNNWALPAADGQTHPLTWFSPNMISWCQTYNRTTDQVRDWLEMSARERLLGAVAAFEPGYSSSSFYSSEIPFPVDAIPYAVTRFAHRTYLGEPNLAPAAFRDRLYRKFFTPEVAPQLADDVLWLFDCVRTCGIGAANATERRLLWRDLKKFEDTDTAKLSAAEKTAQIGWVQCIKNYAKENEPRIQAIESRIAAEPVSARSKRSFAMMRRCVEDIRSETLMTPEGKARINALSQRLGGKGVRTI